MKRRWKIVLALALTRQQRFDYHLGVHEYIHSTVDAEVVRIVGQGHFDWKDVAALKPDGVIGALDGLDDLRCASQLKVPVVDVVNNVEWPARFKNFTRVCPDSIAAGRLAAEFLLERGHTHFAFVGDQTYFFTDQRLEGYVKRLAKAGRECRSILLRQDELASARFAEWLCELPQPAAVLCSNDGVAHFTINLLQRKGITVPDPIAVMGIGNRERFCIEDRLSLTSVDLNPREVGRRAAEVLHQKFQGLSLPANSVLIAPAGVIERQSTDVFPVADALVKRALWLISRTSNQTVDVNQLSQQLGVSRRKLERQFRKIQGRAPYEVIIEMRLKQAAELLRSTWMPIEEVAHKCGFSDARLLYDHFRKHHRLSPAQYRRQRIS